MQILQHQQQRLLFRETREKLRAVPEQSRLAIALFRIVGGRILGERRTDCSQPVPATREHIARGGIQIAQQVHQRVRPDRVRNAALHRIHPADRHRPTILLGALGDRLRQSRLPDPGRPGDHVHAAVSGCGVAQPFA